MKTDKALIYQQAAREAFERSQGDPAHDVFAGAFLQEQAAHYYRLAREAMGVFC